MKTNLVLLFAFFSWTSYAQVNPVLLGSAQNAIESSSTFSSKSIITQQNNVFACDSLGLVAFIHRQNTNVFGSGTGKFRYDVSTNKGQSFSNDIGPLQTQYTHTAEIPQISAINKSNTTNPANAKLVWTASTLPNFQGGIVSGLSNIVSSGNPSSTETYQYQGTTMSHQGGLCQGKANEYWMAEQKSDGFYFLDSIYLYKGVYNASTQDIDWAIAHRKYVPYNYSYDGTSHTTIPNVAFSPDGMTGWCVFLGDLVGGLDSSLTVIYLKTTNGGITWSNPQEINLLQFPNIGDPYIFNPDYNMLKPGFDGDFDISVDVNGNLHFFGHVLAISSYQPAYTLASGAMPVHSMVDVTTKNGGSTWYALEVGEAYTFYYNWAENTTVSMKLQPQISRTEDGNYIFYAWTDSDTALSNSGIGYGSINNLAPNLRINGMDAATQTFFGIKQLTKSDLLWDGKALFPTMAPTVLRKNNRFQLPIVMSEFVSNSAENTCNYWYFGNDAYFLDPSTYLEANQALDLRLFPNPSKEYLTIAMGEEPFSVEILGLDGTRIQSADTENNSPVQINISILDAGIYIAKVTSKAGRSHWVKWIKE